MQIISINIEAFNVEAKLNNLTEETACKQIALNSELIGLLVVDAILSISMKRNIDTRQKQHQDIWQVLLSVTLGKLHSVTDWIGGTNVFIEIDKPRNYIIIIVKKKQFMLEFIIQ